MSKLKTNNKNKDISIPEVQDVEGNFDELEENGEFKTHYDFYLDNKLTKAFRDMGVNIEKNQKYFKFDGDIFYAKNKVYSRGPVITGCPVIKHEKYRAYVGRSKMKRKPIPLVHKTSRNLSIWKLINYPLKKFGSPQIKIKGGYGEGKSIIINLFVAFYLGKGVRILMFIDSAFEARNLAMHGYFDRKTGVFTPFQIKVMIPKNYEFDKENSDKPFLWEERKNVELVYYQTAGDIVKTIKPHQLVCVYTECFTEQGILNLFNEISTHLQKSVRIDKHYLFVHHEFSVLFPESPTKEVYSRIEIAVTKIRRYRKDRIGICTSYHEDADARYKIGRKFTYEINKRPVNKGFYTPAERDARSYSKSELNVSRGEYFRKHRVEYFPETPDKYRIHPSVTLDYPSLQSVTEMEGKKEQPFNDIDFQVLRLLMMGLTQKEIAEKMGYNPGYISKVLKRVKSEPKYDFTPKRKGRGVKRTQMNTTYEG